MNLQELKEEKQTLLELKEDLKQRLADEQERFTSTGIRMHVACTWRSFVKQKITDINLQLVELNRQIRELEASQSLSGKFNKFLSML